MKLLTDFVCSIQGRISGRTHFAAKPRKHVPSVIHRGLRQCYKAQREELTSVMVFEESQQARVRVLFSKAYCSLVVRTRDVGGRTSQLVRQKWRLYGSGGSALAGSPMVKSEIRLPGRPGDRYVGSLTGPVAHARVDLTSTTRFAVVVSWKRVPVV